MSSPPLRLVCRGVRKAFPGVLALDDVSLEVEPGEVHALVGENGAGKSTLIKILCGALTADAGRIELDGQMVSLPSAAAARRLGVAAVHQEFSLVPHLTVAENILLGRWPCSRWLKRIDRKRLRIEAERSLSRIGASVSPRAMVGALSVAEQQLVEIAGALSSRARLLILDEPSAVLTPRELQTLFGVIRDLTRGGVSVLYISHRLDEIFDIADAATVLRDGRRVASWAVRDVSRGELIAAMVGRELQNEFPPRAVSLGEIVLRVENLRARRRFTGVSFQVRSGEVFGLTGLLGAGRTSLLKAIHGALPVDAGSVLFAARRGSFRSPRDAVNAGLAYLPEDRRRDGLLLHRSVRENVLLARQRLALAGLFLRLRKEQALSTRLLTDVKARTAGTEAAAYTLSGGNQQKLLFARWLTPPSTQTPRLLLLDEPTRGVDVGAKSDIYCLINQMAREGHAIVLSSSELPEIIGMADRIGVMARGRLVAILDNPKRDVRQEDILRAAALEERGRATNGT